MRPRAVATVWWLQKGDVETASDNVPNANWNRDGRQANLNRNDPGNVDENIGVRSAVKVHEAPSDFSQPPSMRPISLSTVWDWLIFVSCPTASSRKRRSFRTAIS